MSSFYNAFFLRKDSQKWSMINLVKEILKQCYFITLKLLHRLIGKKGGNLETLYKFSEIVVKVYTRWYTDAKVF